MNGNSKNGFGGAIEVSGPVNLQFIDCEFGGSISELHIAHIFLNAPASTACAPLKTGTTCPWPA